MAARHRRRKSSAFGSDRTLLMPLSSTAGVARGDRIENISVRAANLVLRATAGPRAQWFWPADRRQRPAALERIAPDRRPQRRRRWIARISASRSPPAFARSTACTPAASGQRMGIFSGPGVGKSTLMSQIAKHTSADISVIALIGERGREVQEFLENSLGPEGLARCVVIVSTSDEAPLLRVRAAKVACTVAEFFRDRGKNVLLMMDSLTRTVPGAAADRPGRARAAGDQGISAERLCAAAGDSRARGQIRRRLDHRLLYGAGRRRRFQRADPRCGEGNHRRAPLAEPRAGQSRPFPGDRRYAEHQPRARRCDRCRAAESRASACCG